MSESRVSSPRWGKPQFTATLLLESQMKLSFRRLQEELRRLAPDAVLGDWTGPIADPAADLGVEMLSLDEEKLSVLVIDAPAPAAILQPGPFPNPLWPNAESEAAHHKAHILVLGLENRSIGRLRWQRRASSRSSRLLLRELVPAIGVSWADGANLMRAAGFLETTKNIGQPSANAVPFWVRIMLAKGNSGPRGEPMLKAGTAGLRIFGLRELEYASSPLNPGFIVPHAYSTAAYLLTSGNRLADGETIGVEGEERFSISHADTGDFIEFPIARLTLENGA